MPHQNNGWSKIIFIHSYQLPLLPPLMAAAVVRVGVLALQGSFREHMSLLQTLENVSVIEVRTKEELESVSGLIIPGGESTTMAHVAERWGLIPELRKFAAAGRPIWGTCAGMIFLAERAEGACVRAWVTMCSRHIASTIHQGVAWLSVSLPRSMFRPALLALVAGMKKGGQALLGGLDILVSRNFFGAQVLCARCQLDVM